MTVLKGGSQVFDLAPSEVLTISALGSGSLAYVSVESAIGTPPTISAAPVTGGNTTSVGPFTVQCSIKVYVVGRASVARGDGSPVSGAGVPVTVNSRDANGRATSYTTGDNTYTVTYGQYGVATVSGGGQIATYNYDASGLLTGVTLS